MSIIRNRSNEDHKMLNLIMEEAWQRYRETDIYHILSFQDGAWMGYKGTRYVEEEPELGRAIFQDNDPNGEAYEAGRAWIKTRTEQGASA